MNHARRTTRDHLDPRSRVDRGVLLHRDGTELDGALTPNTPLIRIDDDGRPVLVERRQVAEGPEAGTAAPVPPPREIRYRLSDFDGRPIVGGRIRRARDGSVLGTTDANGDAIVLGSRINAVVFEAEGHLLDHYFDRPEAARDIANRLRREGVAVIRLRRDDLTVSTSFRFMTPNGPAKQTEFRIECREEPLPDGRAVPTARFGAGATIPPELRAAWARHVLLASMPSPRFTDQRWHFAGSSHGELFHAPEGEATVHFASAGAHRIAARQGSWFRRMSFEVVQGGVVDVDLRAGGFVRGQVVAKRDRQPIANAGVSLHRGDEIEASDVTGADGQFELGPLASSRFTLRAHHPAFQEFELRGVKTGRDRLALELLPLAKNAVRGVVLARPDRRPVVGAVVRLKSGDGIAGETKTAATGGFELASHLIEPEVEIAADGYLVYAESLNANGERRTFELIPATAESRVQSKLTSLVFGTVFDSSGKPAPNRPIHVQPVDPKPPAGFDGRRILRGGRLTDPTRVISGADGTFRFEWPRTEAIRLLAVKGIPEPTDGEVVQALLGRKHRVDLRDPR